MLRLLLGGRRPPTAANITTPTTRQHDGDFGFASPAECDCPRLHPIVSSQPRRGNSNFLIAHARRAWSWLCFLRRPLHLGCAQHPVPTTITNPTKPQSSALISSATPDTLPPTPDRQPPPDSACDEQLTFDRRLSTDARGSKARACQGTRVFCPLLLLLHLHKGDQPAASRPSTRRAASRKFRPRHPATHPRRPDTAPLRLWLLRRPAGLEVLRLGPAGRGGHRVLLAVPEMDRHRLHISLWAPGAEDTMAGAVATLRGWHILLPRHL